MMDVMKDANAVMKKNAEKQEEFTEQLELAKELQNDQKMNREMMNEYLQDSDDEDLDDELAAFEQEANQEAAMKMNKQFNQADENIIDPHLQPAQKTKKKDNVDDMFAE